MGEIESTPSQTVVVVHAFAGDEAAVAGALAALSASRSSVTLLCCVEPDQAAPSPAAALLGITDVRVLGSVEARWTGRPERRYRRSVEGGDDALALAAAEPGEIAADIAAVLIAVQPDVVITASPAVLDPHPDRLRVAEAVHTASEVIGIPLYVATAEKGDIVIDSAAVLDARRAVLESLGSDRDPARAESYRRDRPAAPRRFADLHLSTRIVTAVVALVFGAVIGAVLTAAHQASVDVRGVAVPWGLILGLVVAAALFAGLRLVTGDRLLAGCAALGFLVAEAVLALQTAGGSVLVPDNALGYAWTWGPVLIALVVLAWPQVTSRSRDRLETVPAAKGLDSK